MSIGLYKILILEDKKFRLLMIENKTQTAQTCLTSLEQ